MSLEEDLHPSCKKRWWAPQLRKVVGSDENNKICSAGNTGNTLSCKENWEILEAQRKPRRINIIIGCDETHDPVLMGIIQHGDQVKFMSLCSSVEFHVNEQRFFDEIDVPIKAGKSVKLRVGNQAPEGPFLYKVKVPVPAPAFGEGDEAYSAEFLAAPADTGEEVGS